MDIPTKEDFENFKQEILREIRDLKDRPNARKKFIKSIDVENEFLISQTKLYEMRKSGKIPFMKVGGHYLYDYDELVSFFKNESE